LFPSGDDENLQRRRRADADPAGCPDHRRTLISTLGDDSPRRSRNVHPVTYLVVVRPPTTPTIRTPRSRSRVPRPATDTPVTRSNPNTSAMRPNRNVRTQRTYGSSAARAHLASFTARRYGRLALPQTYSG